MAWVGRIYKQTKAVRRELDEVEERLHNRFQLDLKDVKDKMKIADNKREEEYEEILD